MNRTNICKNIIQSIKDYIMDPVKLEPHRAEKHFVRKRKLTLLHVIIYLLYSSKASMFQNLSRIRDDLSALSFPDVSKQALSKARQFINPSLFKELYGEVHTNSFPKSKVAWFQLLTYPLLMSSQKQLLGHKKRVSDVLSETLFL